jgi:hypothetical protein
VLPLTVIRAVFCCTVSDREHPRLPVITAKAITAVATIRFLTGHLRSSSDTLLPRRTNFYQVSGRIEA